MRRVWGVLAAVLLCTTLAAPLLLCPPAPSTPAPPAASASPALSARPAASAPPAVTAPPAASAPGGTASPAATAPPYRAVWVSYLEWQTVDFSTERSFTAAARQICQDIAAAGGTVLLAQLRPFGDALYPSRLFPFSHLCTGTQGQDPGYDPLAVLLREAHAAGLQLEGWLNPYRLRVGGTPAAFAETSPARRFPDWVRTVGTDCYLDPANPAVRQYLADGLAELCEGYALDGIHFDDYFYPTTDPAFDAADYAASGSALPLADWRRQNVDALVRLCYQTAHRYGVRFGISPAGQPALNYEVQYSDTARWLAEGGYLDYLMPQLYWGLGYTKDGSTAQSLTELAAAWAALPRAEGVALYAGLGAYRIGRGDGSDTEGEWRSGHALADQWTAAERAGFDGAGLYRYASLWQNDDFPGEAAAERAALTGLWLPATPPPAA